MATTAPTADQLDMAREELRRLRRRHRAFAAWHAACDAYSAGNRAALDGKRRPSKDAKHRMYDSAYRLIRLLKLDVRHPRTLEDIAAVITAAAGHLARRPRKATPPLPYVHGTDGRWVLAQGWQVQQGDVVTGNPDAIDALREDREQDINWRVVALDVMEVTSLVRDGLGRRANGVRLPDAAAVLRWER
ncbi:hypothetical protein [Micromonospora sp. WMMC273]|uniref:hypothetical protein n=1 Tax=Micromonospora sp. WMMC273 TaxID=3015157 RepID=UPI0022B6F9DC|nr:hypothetical protein [Micromonospora sp. WMMC273]MCZ7478893.1 hypothetical protein [Micromonospora sp. WMMC273]